MASLPFPTFYEVDPQFLDEKRKSLVKARFYLSEKTKAEIRQGTPIFGFGEFGKAVYYRTYSRRIRDEKSSIERQEHWADTVIRVVEGLFSIRKDHQVRNILEWDEKKMQEYARELALSMFRMEWLPPGRGLWACGTDFVYQRGAAALNNCAFTTSHDLAQSMVWTADMLMCGCGVGVYLDFTGEILSPDKRFWRRYVIPDNREGWANSVGLLISAYLQSPSGDPSGPFPAFDYSQIRPRGTPLRGFGGTASGPEPLIELHRRLEIFFDTYLLARDQGCGKAFDYLLAELRKISGSMIGKMSDSDFSELQSRVTSLVQEGRKTYDKSRLVADVANSIGVCVVAGNIRRSAMILLGDVGDKTFLDLKNSKINPERADICWMSNNTVVCKQTEDFYILPEIARRVVENGEPGFYNLINTKRYGRYGRVCRDPAEWTREYEEDQAVGLNPCGESNLEDKELCNLSEIFPTRCKDVTGTFSQEVFLRAVEYATFYASTVSLLPTHWPCSNCVIARNRRIGVSLSGIADFYDSVGFTKLTKILREGYKKVRQTNRLLAREAGVPESIRVTVVKPSGTIAQIVGVSSGIHFPTFKYALRRMRMGQDSHIAATMIASDYPYEEDVYSPNTLVVEFPIDQGKTRKATEVSIWEQLMLTATLQREWSDNSVSATIYFNPNTEGSQVEWALAQISPLVKALSLLPHTPEGVYRQSPYQELSKEEYEARVRSLKPIDWNSFGSEKGSDGECPKYCTNDSCIS